MFPNKIELTRDKYPAKEDFKSGGPASIVENSSYIIRPEPLSSFKRGSKFRLFGESILNLYDLDFSKYTLIFNSHPEWYSYFTLSKL